MKKIEETVEKRKIRASEIFRRMHLRYFWKLSVKDIAFTLVVFIVLTLISFIFSKHGSDPTLNIAMLYTLGVFVVSRYTTGYLTGILFTFASVLSVNFFFTYPYRDFNFSLQGYQLTFIGMIIIGIITSFTSTIMKEQSNIMIAQEKALGEQEKKLVEAEKEKMRANLLRAVSHDLRTPLTGIIGNSNSIIEMGNTMTEEEKVETITSIENDANWLLNMVENLLTVTRIDTENATVSKGVEAIEEVVEASVQQFKKRFSGEQLKVTLPKDFLMCKMDPLLIEQVIINLLQNAVVHSKTAKPIELYVTEEEKTVSFHVKDYGVGIDPTKLETIFDGENFKEKVGTVDGYKGMGIGLSICKTIILAHGGKIECFNHESGAEFVFSLPKED